MDAQAALDELTTLSQQVVEAVITSADGRVVASTVGDMTRAESLGRAGAEMLSAVADLRAGGAAVERVEVALNAGSVFCVREGERSIVATTIAEPTPGLVLYDLRTALRRSAEAAPRRRRTRAKREETTEGA
jgi:predicted regulator of Ras-like GTPase activity (Roadblock/LC7/MglB family)